MCLVLGDVELEFELVGEHHDRLRQHLRLEDHAGLEHDLLEAREHREPFGDDPLADERPFALLAAQVPLAHEVGDGDPDRGLADIEEAAEFFLGGDLGVDGPLRRAPSSP